MEGGSKGVRRISENSSALFGPGFPYGAHKGREVLSLITPYAVYDAAVQNSTNVRICKMQAGNKIPVIPRLFRCFGCQGSC